MYAPFEPNSTKDSLLFDGRPQMSHRPSQIRRTTLNDDYIGHIYSFASTIPKDYLYWYSPSPRATLTVTGESKAQVLKKFRDALLNSKLELAGNLAVELHCSGYFSQAFNIIVEIAGSHVHIHNPNICSHLAERYKKFKKQLGLPSQCGTTHFPENNKGKNQDQSDQSDFFNKPEVQAYRSTINCQTVRNFVIETVTLICLSHQKEMSLPRVGATDVTVERLCDAAKSIKVGGKNPARIAKKNELTLVLKVIEKFLLFKNPKVEDVIYWVLWIVKLESKCKRKGEKLPCKAIKVQNVARSETNHWVWYIWKSLFTRVNFCPMFKKLQIANIYYLFCINFKKSMVICRLPLLFFALRLLKYDMANSFPAVINHLHLHVQACSNVNVLYRNLQIRLARKSWVNILGPEAEVKVDKKVTNRFKKVAKLTKTQEKRKIKEKELFDLNSKTAYLDIVPRTNTVVG
jgi:hypothetical protein